MKNAENLDMQNAKSPIGFNAAEAKQEGQNGTDVTNESVDEIMNKTSAITFIGILAAIFIVLSLVMFAVAFNSCASTTPAAASHSVYEVSVIEPATGRTVYKVRGAFTGEPKVDTDGALVLQLVDAEGARREERIYLGGALAAKVAPLVGDGIEERYADGGYDVSVDVFAGSASSEEKSEIGSGTGLFS